MKIAILGTPSFSLSHLKKGLEGEIAYEVSHVQQLDRESLVDCEILIVFFQGQELQVCLNLLENLGKTIICHTSGVRFEESFKKRIENKGGTWIHASSLSLTSSVLQPLTYLLSQMDKVLGEYSLQLDENINKNAVGSDFTHSLAHILGEDVKPFTTRVGHQVSSTKIALRHSGERLTIEHSQVGPQGQILALNWILGRVKNDLVKKGFSTLEEIVLAQLLQQERVEEQPMVAFQ